MKRRRFLAGAAAAAFARAARAQVQPPRRIGFLHGAAPSQEQVALFLASLSKLGWIEGENVKVEWRSARGGDPRPLAEELVALEPDVLLSNGTPATRALQRATRTIPIVFVSLADPVGDGFVESLARPGGNITGFSTYDPGLSGKWIEILKLAAPGVRRIAIVFNPDTAPHSVFLGPLLASSASRDVSAEPLHVRAAEEIERELAAFAAQPGGGLIAMPDGFTNFHRKLLAAAAQTFRLPGIYPFRPYALDGGLISYGVDIADQIRQAPTYVDRLLRGGKAAELPVQTPVKYELVINMKTAQALALTIPPSLLAQADEVIE
jgi:putative ABC transport system substrate-binding protein